MQPLKSWHLYVPTCKLKHVVLGGIRTINIMGSDTDVVLIDVMFLMIQKWSFKVCSCKEHLEIYIEIWRYIGSVTMLVAIYTIPFQMGLGKRFGGSTLDILTTNCGFISKFWNVDVISVLLRIANVRSPIYFALVFAAATAQAIRSYMFKKGTVACF